MRQYVAAINAAHADCGFDKPFDGGDDQTAAIAGLGLLQADLGPEISDSERIYLPAAHAAVILDHALSVDVELIDITDHAAVSRYRDEVSIAFNFADFGRGDTQAGMRESDVAVDDAASVLLFRLRKQKGKKAKQHKSVTFQWPAGVLTDVKLLLLRWLSLRRRLRCLKTGLMWRLPWDTAKFDGQFFDDLVQRVLPRFHLAAPGNFVFRSHSLREGAASESFAINVQYDKLCFCGGWAIGSDTPRLHYIDFTCPPSSLHYWSPLLRMVNIHDASGAGAPFAAVTAPAATSSRFFGNRVPTRVVITTTQSSGAGPSRTVLLLPHSESRYFSIERSDSICNSW